jgi:hypothetical protein
MPDTVRSKSALLTLCADNSTGDISPQDLRDVIVTAEAWSGVSSGENLYVDATKGDDAIGKPYLTLMAARAAAASGDTIVVRSGTYTLPLLNHQLGKDGVNWHFEVGAVIRIFDAAANLQVGDLPNVYTGFFDDSSSGTGLAGPLRCRVSGHGQFIFETGGGQNTGHRGLILVTNLDSDIQVECDSITIVNASNQYISAVACQLGKLAVRARRITSASIVYAAVWWRNGDLHVLAETISAVTAIEMNLAAGAMLGALWLTANQIIGNFRTVSTNALATAWVHFKEMQGAIGIGSGKLYLTGQKVLASTSGYAVDIQGGALWLHLDKITVQGIAGDANSTAAGYLFLNAGAAHVDVAQFEDLGISNQLVDLETKDSWLGGTVVVQGGTHYVRTNVLDVNTPTAPFATGGDIPFLVLVTGGTLHWTGRAQSSDAGAYGFGVSGSGVLILETAAVVLTGVVFSLYAASAKNMYAYGTVVTNANKHANITLIGDTSGFIFSGSIV